MNPTRKAKLCPPSHSDISCQVFEAEVLSKLLVAKEIKVVLRESGSEMSLAF